MPPVAVVPTPSCRALAMPKRKRIRLKTPRRREQCRTNQARYRKKQIEYAQNLEAAVEQLREEVPFLERQHSLLVSNSRLHALHVVVGYFHHFRHGSLLSGEMPSDSQSWFRNSEAQRQLRFLQSSMADNVCLGMLQGVEALAEQWRRYSTYFDDLHFRLKNMTRASAELTMATAALDVTISESTFEHVLPYLDEENAVLKSRLLGQRLCLPCRLCFEWYGQSKRVVRLDTIDFLPAFQQVLGPLEDTAYVLERALISPDCAIGV